MPASARGNSRLAACSRGRGRRVPCRMRARFSAESSRGPKAARFLRGAGFHVTVTGPGTLALVSAPPTSDIGFPAASGHYNYFGLADRAILFTQLMYQASEMP